ncbi:tetratricopeptide repeat protein [bacterium SCSIO 12741]|nr:tetratricopeptide repeat protein [bacterium SCSIO 12741]
MNKEWLKKNRNLLGLLVLTFLLYSPGLFFDFTNWDDRKLIVQNPYTVLSFSTLIDMFTQPYWLNYMPLTYLSFALERSIFGLSSTVVHFTNLMLHVANVALVFFWIKKLTRGQVAVAFFTAALFAVHPLRAESVVWAAERKDLLYTLFYLLALMRYTDYVLTGKSKYWWLGILFFGLSCLSKGMAVSLSLVLILIDVFLNRKWSWKWVGDKVPFFALSLTFGLIAVWATSTQDQVAVDAVYSWPEKMKLAGMGFIIYTWQHIWPFDLSPIHPYPEVSSWRYWLYPFAALLMGGLAMWRWKRFPALLFGLGFFTVNLLFVLQLYATNNSFVADHYTYLASVGMFFLWARGITWFKNNYPRFQRTDLVKLAWMMTICLSLLTWKQNQIWQNSETLWTRVIEVYPDYWKGYLSRGQHHLENWNFEPATADLRQAYELNPNQEIVAMSWAQNLIYTKNHKEAGEVLKAWVEQHPDHAKGWSMMASLAYELQGYEKAIEFAEKAIELDPDYSVTYYYLGCSQVAIGQSYSAIGSFTRQIELNPLESARSYQMRGYCYNIRENYDQALNDLYTSVSLDPEFAKAYLGIADILLRRKNDRDGACQAFARAAELGDEQGKKLHVMLCQNKTQGR